MLPIVIVTIFMLTGCGDTASPRDGSTSKIDGKVSQPDGGSVDAPNCPGAKRYYPDLDKDGFGDRASAGKLACSKPAGYVDNKDDCADDDADIFPGQTKFFDKATQGNATQKFDYNCDGTEETESKLNAVLCNHKGLQICEKAFPKSWWSKEPPACGETKQFVIRCKYTGGALDGKCEPVTQGSGTQVCR